MIEIVVKYVYVISNEKDLYDLKNVSVQIKTEVLKENHSKKLSNQTKHLKK